VTVLTDPAPVLLIERYDRIVSGDRIERLHQVDLCQLAGVLPDHKYEADGGPGFKECFAQLDKYSTSPAADRLRLVDWTIFNYLIGNADAHAKNLSMLYVADGGLRLSPAYDLLATGYWPDLSDKMAMAIGGERRPAWVQSRHWERFCADVGLNLVQLRRRALSLSEKALEQIDDVFASLTPTKAFSNHIMSTIEQNAKRIDKRLTAPSS
jgi:serine/threonine-protein kinase HipA